MRSAQLYRITYKKTNQVYYGSTWAPNKTYHMRFQEHLTGKGSKFIAELIESGEAQAEDFSVELLLIGPVQYVCDLESTLAKEALYPTGLNGNAGKNIIRTAAGQAVVSAAVSKAKTGITKELSKGVALQAQKVAQLKGDARTEKQKEWDAKKSDYNRKTGNAPPTLVRGSKKMTNGETNTFVPPDRVDEYLSLGWRIGSCKAPWNKGKKIPNMKPRSTVTCPHCGKTGNISAMSRWHLDNCKKKL